MSLKSVARYIANVGKSVGYATVRRIDEHNKSIKGFKENNAELFKTIYIDLRYYNHSASTGKHLNYFLGETLKDTDKKIKNGEYQTADLN